MVMTKGRNRRWEEVEKDSIELSALARHFELYNRTEGKSPKTIDWYNQALTLFQPFLIESEKSTSFGDLHEPEVREFILYIQDRRRWVDNPCVVKNRGKLAAITIQTHIRALRGFFNWLYREGYTSENRLAWLKPPKAPAKVFDVLTREEINRILKYIDYNMAGGARNYAILMLFLDAGLRCSELRNFELEDINIDSGYLKMMGKGSKERVVTFGASTQKALL